MAVKTGMETQQGIRYKLHMISIPIDGATHIYGDSVSVIDNTTKPKSILKKKNNDICCHTLCQSIAMGESITAHIDGDRHPADL